MQRSKLISRTGHRNLQIVCLGLLATLCVTAFAEAKVLKNQEIESWLDGARIEGNQNGAKWSQSFEASGTTIYVADGRPSQGYWRVRDDKYCSQWPPSEHWACYEIIVDGEKIIFLPDSGGDPWPAARQPK